MNKLLMVFGFVALAVLMVGIYKALCEAESGIDAGYAYGNSLDCRNQ